MLDSGEVLSRSFGSSVLDRNEANEPPVVKNVCAVLTGGEPKHATRAPFFKFKFCYLIILFRCSHGHGLFFFPL